MGWFGQPQPAVPEVDPRQADSLVREGDAVLVDVREPGEWTAGHAPGAVHVPLGEFDLDRIPRDRAVVAVCRSGRRSEMVTKHLLTIGVDARNLAGGMQAWDQVGLPVVRDDGSPGVVV